jgi:hypothetical protein
LADFNSFLENHLIDWRKNNVSNQDPLTVRGKTYSWILPRSEWKEGLWGGIRESLPEYVEKNEISMHKAVNNLKSSWISCANLYFPFRDRGRPMLAGFLRDRLSADIREVENVELEYAEAEPLDPRSLHGESSNGKRGANQTSPDVAFVVKTGRGRGLILTENKLTEHHFYACSGKGDAGDDYRKHCLNWDTLKGDVRAQCWQMHWKKDLRKYWDHVRLSERGQRTLKRCPAATDGYQLFRQQALAEAIAADERKKYDTVFSCVSYDGRNAELLRCLKTTGVDDFAKGWGDLFDGRAKFAAWTHQEWVSWVRNNDPHRNWGDWLSYVESRYGYRNADG